MTRVTGVPRCCGAQMRECQLPGGGCGGILGRAPTPGQDFLVRLERQGDSPGWDGALPRSKRRWLKKEIIISLK